MPTITDEPPIDLRTVDTDTLYRELARRKNLEEMQINPFGRIHIALDLVADLVTEDADDAVILPALLAVRNLIPRRGKAMLLIHYSAGRQATAFMMIEEPGDGALSREEAIYSEFQLQVSKKNGAASPSSQRRGVANLVEIEQVFRMGPGDATFTHFIHAALFPPH